MGRLLKWAAIIWIAGEWFNRGGREWLLGASAEVEPGLTEFTIEVEVPTGGWNWTDIMGRSITWHGEPVGRIVGVDGESVRATFDRTKLGWPIHVAVSQAQAATRALFVPS